MTPIAERFWSKVDRSDECWTFTGSVSANGYGRFYWRAAGGWAHRAAYLLAVGPIATGMEIDHLCRNRLCVRPDHLEAVPHRVNVRRGANGDLSHLRLVPHGWRADGTYPRPARPVCGNGHAMTPTNVRVVASGGRICKECDRVRHALYRARRPGAVA